MVRRLAGGSGGWAAKAALEVGLIFVGITLAISFDNWNETRSLRAEERATLEDLRSDLMDNVVELDRNVLADSLSVIGIDTILLHLEARLPYSDDLSNQFANLENWASPYFTRAAYETLKGRGVGLIEDRTLRNAIVNLFDLEYAFLIGDLDREEWVHLEVVVLPITMTRIEEVPGDIARPIDYEGLFDDTAFRVALLRSSALRLYGLGLKRDARTSTLHVIEMIDAQLGP